MIPCTFCPSSLFAATASRSMSPVEIAGTRTCRERTAAWVPLPEPGGPRSTTFNVPSQSMSPPRVAATASPPSPTDAAFLHEPLVVAHHELALDLLDRVHRDAD